MPQREKDPGRELDWFGVYRLGKDGKVTLLTKEMTRPNGIGFSLEHGYRVLHKTTRLTTQPLLSRQAVHVLGINQSFSNRKARELLGWEPRVGYAAGLEATVAWLQAEGV